MATLLLPNGHRTSSDRIRHVKAFPARSPSLHHAYLAIYEDAGLVYEGLVDLNRVVAGEAGESPLRSLLQRRFELLQFA